MLALSSNKAHKDQCEVSQQCEDIHGSQRKFTIKMKKGAIYNSAHLLVRPLTVWFTGHYIYTHDSKYVLSVKDCVSQGKKPLV